MNNQENNSLWGENAELSLDQQVDGAQDFTENNELRRDAYLKHFIVDFMEFTLRKVAYENSIKCVK